MDAEEVRGIALSLPEVEEYDHGGLPSFRVRGKRFASMLDRDGVNLAPGEEAIRAAVAEWPRWCREEWFGKRLVAMRVEFESIDPTLLGELITDAWASKAPKTLVRSVLGAAQPHRDTVSRKLRGADEDGRRRQR